MKRQKTNGGFVTQGNICEKDMLDTIITRGRTFRRGLHNTLDFQAKF